jgi:pectate lyase
MGHVTHESRGHVRRLVTTAASVLALLVVGAPAALAAPGAPQLTVSGSTPTSVSLTATGFARQSTVEFTVTVGSCTGRSSVVASTDVLVAQFVTTPTCTGPATATATAGTQTASLSFTFAPTSVGGAQATGSAGPVPSPGTPPGTPPAGTPSTGAPAAGGAATDAAAQSPGRRPVTSSCTVQASGGDVPAAKPGDTVCFTGTLPKRLEIKGGGNETAPVTYSGMGTAVVPGITARGSNIVLEGFVSKGAKDNGVYVAGNNITIRDNDISQVYIGDDDVDAIRFFGDGITIAHNTAHDIWANPSPGRRPHTDCMQTYTGSEAASSNIRIEGNHCASPQFRQCLMAEGPNDDDGDGKGSGVGRSANWLVTNNHFECHAPAQTIALQDIHDVTFSANDFVGTGNKAIALQKDATGATVTPDNTKGPGYKKLVGIDHDSARQGYRGPDS